MPEIKRVSKPTEADAELPSHLEEMFGRAESQLTGEQGDALKKLLVEYGDIFAKHEMDLGEFSEVTHKIEVGGPNRSNLDRGEHRWLLRRRRKST